jgi:hypothetical protein
MQQEAGLLITWPALAALTVLVGAICTAFAVYVRMSIKAALVESENRLFTRLNGKYVGAKLCEERHHESERRLLSLEGAPAKAK